MVGPNIVPRRRVEVIASSGSSNRHFRVPGPLAAGGRGKTRHAAARPAGIDSRCNGYNFGDATLWSKWKELVQSSRIWNRRYVDLFVAMSGTLALTHQEDAAPLQSVVTLVLET